MGSINNSKYKVVPSTPEDAGAIIDCGARAFANDPMNQLIRPKEREHLTSKEEYRAFHIDRIVKRFGPNAYLFNIKDPADPTRVVAFATWYGPGYFSKTTLLEQSDQQARQHREATQSSTNNNEDTSKSDIPACIDAEVQGKFLEILDKSRKDIWGDDDNWWYLASLAVDPDFQRQGLGRMIMEFGANKSDEDGVPLYIEATPDGAHLYEKVGCERIKEYEFEMGGSTHVMTHFLRHPKKQA